MQTFFNPTTPFFDGEGRPLVGAMVSFLDLETSASLIPLTDSDGVALPNPLYTGEDGRMRLENGNGAPAVPCIADGLSYKVTVARRTGVEPVYIGDILQNASELYEEPDIAFVVTAMNKPEGTDLNTTVVGSIAAVRLANKDLGSVVCTGYYSAGDCPSRTFTWVTAQNPPEDNAINILRNPEDATGYWKMSDPDGGLWDIRVAGCSTSKTAAVNDQCLTRLVNVIDSSGIATVYFPAGNWLLDSGYSFGSLCLEKGANLKPADNTADRTVTVDRLENRGGKFFAYGDGAADKKRVVLVLNGGTLRTSWFDGTLNEFLTEDAVDAPEEFVFDSIDRLGSAEVTISKKVIRVYDGVTYNTNKIKDSGCFVFRYSNGSLHATSYSITNPNAGVTLDLAGLRMGDSSSNVEVNHAGMVAKNSDESYTMQVDFSAIVFHTSGHTGTLDAEKVSISYSGGAGSTLTSTELTVSNDLDWAEYNAHGIDSSEAISIAKGAYMPWPKKTINAASPNIDNTLFGDDEEIVVVADWAAGTLISVLSASPTLGRVIKLSAFGTAPSGYFALTDSSSNIIVMLHSGGSVYLVADGSTWKIDYTRI